MIIFYRDKVNTDERIVRCLFVNNQVVKNIDRKPRGTRIISTY